MRNEETVCFRKRLICNRILSSLILLTVCLVLIIAFCSSSILAQGAGTALNFDGVADRGSIPDPPGGELDFDTGDFTISFWIKTDENPFGSDWPIILNKEQLTSPRHGYEMVIQPDTDGRIYFQVRSEGQPTAKVLSLTPLNDNKWHYIAGKKTGTELELFVDGISQGIDSHSLGSTSNDLPLTFGRRSDGNYPFKGSLDEIQIWNVALDKSNVRENMNNKLTGNESGLVGYWQFDEGSGTTINDATANGNTGTLMSSSMWITSTAPVGSGNSSTQTVSSPGLVSFTGTNLEMNFTAKSGTDEIVVTEITNSPGGILPPGGNEPPPKYWVVKQYGNGTFTADLTFTVGSISSTDLANPNNLKLFGRDSNSDGAWTVVASASSATSSTVTFTGISSFSQFTIVTLFQMGDVSGDGKITAYDASLVLRYIVGLTDLSVEQKQVADVTDDNTITALDAAFILQYCVGLITEFPNLKSSWNL